MNNKKFYDYLYEPDNINYGEYQENIVYQYTDRETRLRQRTEELISTYSNKDSQILEIGASTGGTGLQTKAWTGLEYSSVAITLAKTRFGEHCNIIQGDAQNMPFDDGSFDFVYSWATLEHVENPDLAFKEIDRVTRRSGVISLKPAWNCRDWRVKKIDKIPFYDLKIDQALIKILLPFIENIFIRSLIKIPTRIIKLIKSFGTRELDLRFKRLHPSLSLIEKYGHDADDDAFSSFDIVDAIVFFKSREYDIISHPSLFSIIFARGDILTVRKIR